MESEFLSDESKASAKSQIEQMEELVIELIELEQKENPQNTRREIGLEVLNQIEGTFSLRSWEFVVYDWLVSKELGFSTIDDVPTGIWWGNLLKEMYDNNN